MPADYLHNHHQFAELVRIVAQQKGVDPYLVEKDYWIMHCLYGLQKQGFKFELKGGTSLSKGHRIISRFSEDIDIRIEPPAGANVATGRNQASRVQILSRKDFYDGLAKTIKIEGIKKVERDTVFDNKDYFSGGIRLRYDAATQAVEGVRDGILLELGFDDVTPNTPKDISSCLYDYAHDKVDIIDNRAKNVACYDGRGRRSLEQVLDRIHEISASAGEKGFACQLHASLLRYLRAITSARCTGFHWHGSL